MAFLGASCLRWGDFVSCRICLRQRGLLCNLTWSQMQPAVREMNICDSRQTTTQRHFTPSHESHTSCPRCSIAVLCSVGYVGSYGELKGRGCTPSHHLPVTWTSFATCLSQTLARVANGVHVCLLGPPYLAGACMFFRHTKLWLSQALTLCSPLSLINHHLCSPEKHSLLSLHSKPFASKQTHNLHPNTTTIVHNNPPTTTFPLPTNPHQNPP